MSTTEETPTEDDAIDGEPTMQLEGMTSGAPRARGRRNPRRRTRTRRGGGNGATSSDDGGQPAESLGADELLAMRGRPVYDNDGAVVGKVGEIYLDTATRLPEWIGIDADISEGVLRVVVPVVGARVVDGDIRVAYTTALVLASAADDMEITEAAEARLYAHYGIEYSRADSPTGLPAPDAAEPEDVEWATRSGVEADGHAAAEEPAAATPLAAMPRTEHETAIPPAAMTPGAAEHEGATSSRVSGDGFRLRVSPAQDARADESRSETCGSGEAERARHVLPTAEIAIPAEKKQRASLWRHLAAGAAAGAAATIPMTIAMVVLHRRLPPSERAPLPPRGISENLVAHLRIADRFEDDQITALALMMHTAFGAGSGALYGAFGRRMPGPRWLSGAAYGAAVWTTSYLGWLPAARLHRSASDEPRRRNALMLGTNVLWGVVAGVVFQTVTRSEKHAD